MINLAICGLHGVMGTVLQFELEEITTFHLLGGLSPRRKRVGEEFDASPDVVIDFSNPVNLDFLIDYAKANHAALVICTTGYTEEQLEQIQAAGEFIPVLFSANTSLGVNAFHKALRCVSGMFKDFDISIIEKHHNKKKDAPSGTAKRLAQDITETTGRTDIDIHSIRGGSIPGEHTVLFAGEDELFELKHTALSKKIFAKGALKLAEKMTQLPNGFYTTEEVF